MGRERRGKGIEQKEKWAWTAGCDCPGAECIRGLNGSGNKYDLKNVLKMLKI